MKAAIPTFLVLVGSWLVWSGHYSLDPMIGSFGLFSCLLVTWICMKMDQADGANPGYGLGFRIVSYIPWLVVEIIKSNIHVMRVVLSPSLPISPRLVRTTATQKTDLCRVIYANSITLTPGTISVELENGEITVHALTQGSANDLETGIMDRRVTRLESGL